MADPSPRPHSLLGELLLPGRLLLPGDLPQGLVMGEWRVLARLGAGGYGSVYLVEHVLAGWVGGLPELFALKVTLREGEGGKRLAREAEMLERVKHPNVVELVARGWWPEGRGGLPFLVMRYVKGSSLYTWAEERNRRVLEVVALFRVLARALGALHAAGVMHRDFKGDNVLVRDSDGQPVLVDLGAGYYQGAKPITGPRLPPGTQPYRSPELLRFPWDSVALPEDEAHYDFGPPDEVYALGVTFYRVLVDEYPCEQARQAGRPPPHPSTLNPRVPHALGNLVLRMLAPRREERIATMGEVDEALGALALDPQDWLFEWSEPPSAHSRTTESTGVWGPLAPQDELALVQGIMRMELRQFDWRRKRTLRKRPRPLPPDARPVAPAQGVEVSAVEPTPVQAGSAARRLAAWFLPRGRWLRGCLRAPPLILCLEVGLLSLASEPVLPSPEAYRPHPNAENPSMRAANDRRDSAPEPSTRMDWNLLQQCAAAASAGLVMAACASAPLKPDHMQCGDDARMAMKALRMRPGAQGTLYGHFDQRDAGKYRAIYREGAIVSQVYEYAGQGGLPKGTLLYGWMWGSGNLAYAHYTRAKFPDGRELPVCIALGNFEALGWPRRSEGTEAPGTWTMGQMMGYIVVDRFE